MILISVQELQKSFGIHEVLRSVTFSLQKGEKMGLVGVNGCGKTTLMRLIAGEMQPDGGAIHRNKDLRVGYLAQLDDIPLTDTVWELCSAYLSPSAPWSAAWPRLKRCWKPPTPKRRCAFPPSISG